MTISPAKFFIDRGFREYPDQGRHEGTRAFSKRVTAKVGCACNDGKLSLHARHHVMTMHKSVHESIEFDITAEDPTGEWAKLQAYAVRPQDLTDQKLAQIERKLIAAWEAFAETN